jgi:hypothetical protein
MYAPPDDTRSIYSSQPLLMRLVVRSWDFRHPRAWVRIRVACAVWNLALGVLLLAFVHDLGAYSWLGAIPLAGSALLVWTAYRLQHATASQPAVPAAR